MRALATLLVGVCGLIGGFVVGLVYAVLLPTPQTWLPVLWGLVGAWVAGAGVWALLTPKPRRTW